MIYTSIRLYVYYTALISIITYITIGIDVSYIIFHYIRAFILHKIIYYIVYFVKYRYY